MDNQGAEVRSIRYKYIPVTSATSGFENKIPVLRISPNPACNDITIHTEHLPAGNYHISIYDFQGKLVLQTAAQLSTGAPVVLNIDAVPSGTAVLHVIDAAGQSVLSEKMIKY